MRWAGTQAAVIVPGEVGITHSGQIAAALARALPCGGTVLTADITATTYCDCGVRVLLAAHTAAAAAGARLEVAGGGPMVRRILELTGADQILDLRPPRPGPAEPLPAP